MRVPVGPKAGALRVTLVEGYEAEGSVVDSRGEPVSGAAFLMGHVQEEDLFGPGATDALGMSEDDGVFHVGGIPRGGLAVTVSHPQHGPLQARLSPGKGLQVRLPAEGRVSGIARGEDGLGAAGVPIIIHININPILIADDGAAVGHLDRTAVTGNAAGAAGGVSGTGLYCRITSMAAGFASTVHVNPLIIAVDGAAVVHLDRTAGTASTPGAAGGGSGICEFPIIACIAAIAAGTGLIIHLNPLIIAVDGPAVVHLDRTAVTAGTPGAACGGSGLCVCIASTAAGTGIIFHLNPFSFAAVDGAADAVGHRDLTDVTAQAADAAGGVSGI